jgi:hypothetical protein
MKDVDYKIPPILPLPKGGICPSLAKRGAGRFFYNDSLLTHSLVIQRDPESSSG